MRSLTLLPPELIHATLDGCLEWQGPRNPAGYPYYKKAGAHRVAYELVNGAIPAGMEIDHLCRNRSCVNAAHMEAVSHRENCQRRIVPDACPVGHRRFTLRASGKRQCLDCDMIAQRAKRAARAIAEGRQVGRGGPPLTTHCVHGHERTAENTAIRKSDGTRVCRPCNRMKALASYHRKAAA